MPAGFPIVERLLYEAFLAMNTSTHSKAAKFFPSGICAPEQIIDKLRASMCGMPMTSTSAERMFACGRDIMMREQGQDATTRAWA
eukprot:734297-Pleurochrysis_carterae.AAC.19